MPDPTLVLVALRDDAATASVASALRRQGCAVYELDQGDDPARFASIELPFTGPHGVDLLVCTPADTRSTEDGFGALLIVDPPAFTAEGPVAAELVDIVRAALARGVQPTTV